MTSAGIDRLHTHSNRGDPTCHRRVPRPHRPSSLPCPLRHMLHLASLPPPPSLPPPSKHPDGVFPQFRILGCLAGLASMVCWAASLTRFVAVWLPFPRAPLPPPLSRPPTANSVDDAAPLSTRRLGLDEPPERGGSGGGFLQPWGSHGQTNSTAPRGGAAAAAEGADGGADTARDMMAKVRRPLAPPVSLHV